MPQRGALSELELRKRALVLESAVHRIALTEDAERVRNLVQQKMKRYQSASRSWMWLGAPLAGLLVGRRLFRAFGLFRSAAPVARAGHGRWGLILRAFGFLSALYKGYRAIRRRSGFLRF